MRKLFGLLLLLSASTCFATQDFQVKDGTATFDASMIFNSNRFAVGHNGVFNTPFTIYKIGANPFIQVFDNGRMTIGSQASDGNSFSPLYVFGQTTYGNGNVIARFRSNESDGGEVWIEGGTGQHATLQFNLGNAVEKASIRYIPGSLAFYVSSDTVKALSITDDAVVKIDGILQLPKKTAEELKGITPSDVGQLYFNTSANQLFVSTGTAQGSFSSSADGSVGP